MEPTQIRNILEACLLVAGRPMSIKHLLALFEDDIDKPAKSEVREALTNLANEYEGRGIELVEVASGWRLQTRNTMEHWVSRLFEEKSPRYSRALLETLVLIAYRQPVTRGEIEEVRGVAVSSNIIRTLQDRQWIREVGHKDVPGKPALFGTTREFLDYFNLKQLEDLPPLGKVMDMEQVEAVLAAEIGLVEGASDSVAANDESGDESGGESGEENQAGEADSATSDSTASDEMIDEQSLESGELVSGELEAVESDQLEADSADTDSAKADSLDVVEAADVASASISPAVQDHQGNNSEEPDGGNADGSAPASLSLVEAQTDPGGEVVLLRPLAVNSDQIDVQNLPDEPEPESDGSETIDAVTAEEASLISEQDAQSAESDASDSSVSDDLGLDAELEEEAVIPTPREPQEISSQDILAQAIKPEEGKDSLSLSEIADGFERSKGQAGAETAHAVATPHENQTNEQESDSGSETNQQDSDSDAENVTDTEPEQDARLRLKQVIDNFAGEHQQEIEARDEFESRKLSSRSESDSSHGPGNDIDGPNIGDGTSDQGNSGSGHNGSGAGESTGGQGNEPEMVLQAEESSASHAVPTARETAVSSGRPPILRLVRNEIPASVAIEDVQGIDSLTSLDIQETTSFTTDAGQLPDSLVDEDEPTQTDAQTTDELKALDDNLQQPEAELSAPAELIEVPASVVAEPLDDPLQKAETREQSEYEPDSGPATDFEVETGVEPIAEAEDGSEELTPGERNDDSASPAPDT